MIDGIDGREKDRKGGGERRGKEGEEVKRGGDLSVGCGADPIHVIAYSPW